MAELGPKVFDGDRVDHVCRESKHSMDSRIQASTCSRAAPFKSPGPYCLDNSMERMDTEKQATDELGTDLVLRKIIESTQGSFRYVTTVLNLIYVFAATQFFIICGERGYYCIGVLILALAFFVFIIFYNIAYSKNMISYAPFVELGIHIPMLLCIRLRLQELSMPEELDFRITAERYIMMLQCVRNSCIIVIAPIIQMQTVLFYVVVFATFSSGSIQGFAIPAHDNHTIYGFVLEQLLMMFVTVTLTYVKNRMKKQWQSVLKEQRELREKVTWKEMKSAKAIQESRAMIMHGMKNICASMAATCEVAAGDSNATVESMREDFRQLEGLAQMGVILCNKRAKIARVMDEDFTIVQENVDCLHIINSVRRLSTRILVSPVGSCDGYHAKGDTDVVYFILENALSNALLHGHERSPVEINVACEKSGDTSEVVISISNVLPPGKTLKEEFYIAPKGHRMLMSAMKNGGNQATRDLSLLSSTNGLMRDPDIPSRSTMHPRATISTISDRTAATTEASHNSSLEFRSPASRSSSHLFGGSQSLLQPTRNGHLRKRSLLRPMTRGILDGLGVAAIRKCCKKARYRCHFFQKNNRVHFVLYLPTAATADRNTYGVVEQKCDLLEIKTVGGKGKEEMTTDRKNPSINSCISPQSHDGKSALIDRTRTSSSPQEDHKRLKDHRRPSRERRSSLAAFSHPGPTSRSPSPNDAPTMPSDSSDPTEHVSTGRSLRNQSRQLPVDGSTRAIMEDDHELSPRCPRKRNDAKFSQPRRRDVEKVTPKKYIICCIEDEKMIRKMYQRILVRKYFSPKSIVLGENAQEVAKAVKIIKELNCDGVILDQNLVYAEGTYLGTNIAESLRVSGYQGYIAIRSANTDDSDIQLYLDSGANEVLSKSMNSKKIARLVVNAIDAMYREKEEDAAA